MGKESVVDIGGHQYRYTYDPESKKTLYLGPVGSAPPLSEADFSRLMMAENLISDLQKQGIPRKMAEMMVDFAHEMEEEDMPLWREEETLIYWAKLTSMMSVDESFYLAIDRRIHPLRRSTAREVYSRVFQDIKWDILDRRWGEYVDPNTEAEYLSQSSGLDSEPLAKLMIQAHDRFETMGQEVPDEKILMWAKLARDRRADEAYILSVYNHFYSEEEREIALDVYEKVFGPHSDLPELVKVWGV
jgi:hypothetical protein